MKFILGLSLFLGVLFTAKAQTITGRLMDGNTKKGLILANLSLINEDKTTPIKYIASDTLGNFEFREVKNGKYTLLVTLMGYQRTEKIILVDPQVSKAINLGDLIIAEDPSLLKEVTITGGLPAFSTKNGQLKIGIANNAFFKSSANLLDVFKKLPGLQVGQDGNMQLASRATPTLFIDGKPANMSGEEILTYLSGLSPEMVESIEMINQPSSKYDGEYQGIIDVKLKRNQSLGLKGSYNARLQRNNYSLLEHNLSLGYKTERLSYQLTLGHTAGSTYYKYHALQFLANNNAMTTDTRTTTANQNFNVQARLTYEIKPTQSLEFFARTLQVNRNAVSANHLTTQDNSQQNTLALVKSDNDARPKQHHYTGGLNYDARFKNSELHVMTSLSQINNLQTEDIQNRDLFAQDLLSYWKTNSKNNILIRNVQADYTHNIGTQKLEMGAKFAYTSTHNNLRYDTLGNDIFSIDPKRSNQFRYQEYISAAYLSYLGQWKKFSYSIGLRAEHTRSVANSVTTGQLTERGYLKWLPSINLNYTLSNTEQLSFNYSRRITRPTFAALNPFRFYYSPRHYWIGNPYLQPSTTSLFALTYSRKSFSVSLNAGRETDVMSRYPEYNPATDELIFLGRNLPYRNFANIQISSPITVNKWWRMTHNLGLFYNKELTPYFGKTYRIPIHNYTINGSQIFSLKSWLLDVSYSYESRSGNGLYIMAPVYGIDFGLQKAWLKNKLNTKLTLYDAFDNLRRRLIFREKSIINNDFYHYFAAQRLVLGITYNFGSSTYKSKENKRSDEENRAN